MKRQVKNPFTEKIMIDEPIDVAPFIKIRDAINSIDINSVTLSNLSLKLTTIENKTGMQIFRRAETTVDTLIEMKNKLNAANLDNRTSITLQELFMVDENDAKEYENKYMKKNTFSNDENIAVCDLNKLDEEYKFERGFDPDWDEDDQLSYKYKNDKQKYSEARKLEMEEKNRSYDNYLDPEEREMYKDETDSKW